MILLWYFHIFLENHVFSIKTKVMRCSFLKTTIIIMYFLMQLYVFQWFPSKTNTFQTSWKGGSQIWSLIITSVCQCFAVNLTKHWICILILCAVCFNTFYPNVWPTTWFEDTAWEAEVHVEESPLSKNNGWIREQRSKLIVISFSRFCKTAMDTNAEKPDPGFLDLHQPP